MVNKHYSAEAPDTFSLRRGDLVEVLETSVEKSGADAKYAFSVTISPTVHGNTELTHTNTHTPPPPNPSARIDADLNSIDALIPGQLLEHSAAKHKLSVRPKKTHTSALFRRSASPQSPSPISEPKYACRLRAHRFLCAMRSRCVFEVL